MIVKSERTLTLLSYGQVLKTYKVALGGNPVGPKVKAGDKKAPEGEYVVDSKNAKSRFHLALHVSYPNAADRERARKLGVSPGGDVEIHGLESKYAWVGSLHRQVNWTAGCIAVTNPDRGDLQTRSGRYACRNPCRREAARHRGPEKRNPAPDSPHRSQQTEAVAPRSDRRAESVPFAFKGGVVRELGAG